MLLFTMLAVCGSSAQSTNLARYQELALACLGQLPSGVDRLILTAPDRMPYLRSALVTRWQDQGHAVFLAADTSGAKARLDFDIDHAAVSYSRRRGGIGRVVHLALRYTLIDAGGRILLDDRCVDSRADVISRNAVLAVQNDAYPETQGELPQAGWLRRYLEPAVLTAATAVAVFLFFSLRTSDTEDS